MGKPLDMSPPRSAWGLLEWLLACAFILSLNGCVTPPQQTEPIQREAPPQPEVTQQAPPCPDISVRELEKGAIELLDLGESERGRTLLDCALDTNPLSYTAKVLVEQLDADPVEYLGRRHYRYTVQAGETLSIIAQARLGTSLKFVILARYNGIEVPRNLVAGQTIKIPGDAPTGEELAPSPQPAEVSSTEPAAGELQAQALALEENGNLEQAFQLIKTAKAMDASLENVEVDYTRIKNAFIGDLENKAYNLELSGETEQAIETWQKVLEVDPSNISAQLSINRLSQ